MKSFFTGISKKIRNKKGSSTLETVVGTLIFLMLFAALLDMITLSTRYTVLNNLAKELTRTMSVQGGALNDKPGGYTSNYYTIGELTANVDSNMKAAGFKPGEWTVVLEYDRYYDELTETTVNIGSFNNLGIIGFNAAKELKCNETPKLDYLSNFNITISAKYDWKALPAFIGRRKSTLQVTMPGTSEWKYNYDRWETEIDD